MKKYSFFIFLLLLLSANIYSNELWNGIEIGMSVEEASNILHDRLGARDRTSSVFGARGWSNSHPIFWGHSPTPMKSYYFTRYFSTNQPQFRQFAGGTNIYLYSNENDIVVGVEIQWSTTNFPNMLQNARNAYGNESVVEINTLFGVNRYYIWELDSRMVVLTNFVFMTTTILDKKWYYENIYKDEELESSIIF